MTPGEKMVWAAVYTEHRCCQGRSVVEAARRAAHAVKELHTAASTPHRSLFGDHDALSMLDDVLRRSSR